MGKNNGNTIETVLKDRYREKLSTKIVDEYNSVAFHVISDCLENTKNPVLFYESFMKISQMYYDLCVKTERKFDSKLLEKFFDIGKELSRKFYCGERINKTEYRKKIIPKLSKINRIRDFGDNERRVLRNQKLIDTINYLIDNLPEVEVVIPIMSGGLELGLLSASIYDVDILPLRYSHVTGNDDEVSFPKYLSNEKIKEVIKGKTVLVTDDCVHTGQSWYNMNNYLAGNGAERIYSAVISVSGYSDKMYSFYKILHDRDPFISLLEGPKPATEKDNI